MAEPDRQALADGLVRIGEYAVAKSDDRRGPHTQRLAGSVQCRP